MPIFCYSCGSLCKTKKGLENHLKSRPGCLDALGIRRDTNWAATLGLSTVTTSSKEINHHTFPVETDAEAAAKRPVEVMWQDENDFEVESSSPDSPLKFQKRSSTATSRGGGTSSFLIRHSCGSKTIDIAIDQPASTAHLKQLLSSKLSLPSFPSTDLSPS